MTEYTMVKYWKNGGKWDIWANHLDMVKAFIKEQDLVPMDHIASIPYKLDKEVEMAPMSIKQINKLKKPEEYWERVKGIKGGMRVPHLHFNGDIYMLNDKQWKKFSGMMMDNLKEKLNEANVISFEPMMELTQTIDTTIV